MNLLKKQNQNLFKFLILIFFILSNSAYSEIKFISIHTNQVRVIDGDSLILGPTELENKPAPGTKFYRGKSIGFSHRGHEKKRPDNSEL